MTTMVSQAVASTLKLAPGEIDPDRPLSLYGLDSLSSAELVAALEDAVGHTLPDWFLADHRTVNDVAAALGGAAPRPSLDLMRADAELPADIRPAAAARSHEAAPHVLLTGATGFLGAWLLRELAATPATLTCLVRGDHGLDRVRRNLTRYGLWQDPYASRVRVVSGDIRVPHLGLDAREYHALAESVAVIHHAAADVNWTLPYDGLREPNVIGTRELLRFACDGRAKAFHFISSLSVAYASGGPAMVDERTDPASLLAHLPLGYAQSKAVAESLVRQAAARGLTATITRPPLISGDATTGVSNPDDFIALLLKGCIQLGAAPDLDWSVDALPVDLVARTLVRLPAAGHDLPAFNVTGQRHRHWRECVLWMNLYGYRCALLPWDEWRDRMEVASREPAHALHRLRSFFLRTHAQGGSVPELYQDSRRCRVDARLTRAAETAAGVATTSLTADLLDSYFADYRRIGFLGDPEPVGKRPSRAVRAGATEAVTTASPARLEPLLRTSFVRPALSVRGTTELSSGSNHSILGELTSWRHGRRVGLFTYRLDLEDAGERWPLDVVVKAKPLDTDVIEVGQTVADLCGAELGAAYARFADRTGVARGHHREVALYEIASADERLAPWLPRCYGTWSDDRRGEWGLAIERLTDMALIDATDDVSAWTPRHARAAVDGLAALHAGWAPHVNAIAASPWIGHIPTARHMTEMRPLWQALATHAGPFVSRWAGDATAARQRALVDTIDAWWPDLERSPRTLIHHDCNPRNLALRHDDADGVRLCAYDWELATIGAPERDLAELLCFVLPPEACGAMLELLVERHRAILAEQLGRRIDRETWWRGFRAGLADVLIARLSFYVMIHRVKPLSFLPRVVRTWQRLFDLTDARLAPERSLPCAPPSTTCTPATC